MKQPQPAKAPPIPPHVEVMQVQAVISRFEASGQLIPPVAYLKSQLPQIPMDRWGQPLPLSIAKQERFDRMMAVFTRPVERVTALLHAGSLDTIEANTIRFGHPELYAQLREQVIAEMADA